MFEIHHIKLFSEGRRLSNSKLSPKILRHSVSVGLTDISKWRWLQSFCFATLLLINCNEVKVLWNVWFMSAFYNINCENEWRIGVFEIGKLMSKLLSRFQIELLSFFFYSSCFSSPLCWMNEISNKLQRWSIQNTVTCKTYREYTHLLPFSLSYMFYALFGKFFLKNIPVFFFSNFLHNKYS